MTPKTFYRVGFFIGMSMMGIGINSAFLTIYFLYTMFNCFLDNHELNIPIPATDYNDIMKNCAYVAFYFIIIGYLMMVRNTGDDASFEAPPRTKWAVLLMTLCLLLNGVGAGYNLYKALSLTRSILSMIFFLPYLTACLYALAVISLLVWGTLLIRVYRTAHASATQMHLTVIY
jgi:hypothetical protein